MIQEELWRLYGEPAAKAAFQAGYEQGFQNGEASGFLKGLALGNQIGYANAVDDFKPALSDGLRHRSSECGSAMRSLRGDAVDFVTDEEYAFELAAELST
ncbi:hypothetical protein [Pseudomonas cichorii]|uniref:hypothetical protein n=1 Tax=Pseudomonas cichorii TaxID=36746 RepID=UPI001C8A1103|nr:hypothetical protein [Pseudomonas cichorii]MBX8574602.1 hypothetical protein [Pseudomonas cichorii]